MRCFGHCKASSCLSSLSGQISNVHASALRQARDDILGPKPERGPRLPVRGVGGTAFERSGYADPVEDGARAYSILTSEQKVRGRTVGPGVACKVSLRSVYAQGFLDKSVDTPGR